MVKIGKSKHMVIDALPKH